MKAVISSFRRGRHHQYDNHMILVVEGSENRESAEKLVGKKVVFKSIKAVINGEIVSAHGNKGAVRAIFEKGMPGQSLGKEVEIQ